MTADPNAPPPRPATRRWRREIGWTAVVLFLTSYSWLSSDVSSPNERSRAYLTVALVDHHTLRIDEVVRRHGDVYDKAARGGGLYSDKAPGASLLGAALYGSLRLVQPAEAWPITRLLRLLRGGLMIPIAVLGFLLLRRLLERLGTPALAVDLLSLSWILGTSAFHFSTVFVGHQIVAVSLLGALYLSRVAEETGGERRRGLAALGAGLLTGLAVLTEYQAAVPAALLLAVILVGPLRRQGRAAGALLLGAAVGLAALAAYNSAAFGHPLSLSYDHLVDLELRRLHDPGVAGVAWPRTRYAQGSLLSLHRGLFATSPIFLLTAPGLVLLWRRGERRLALLVGLTFGYFLLLMSGTAAWPAGWGFGPRLLVPMMTWAIIPVAVCASGDRRRPLVTAVVLGLSAVAMIYHQLVQNVFAELPPEFKNPLVDVIVPALENGLHSPNLSQRLFDLRGLPALLLPAGVLAGALVILAARVVRLGRGWRARTAAVLAACLAAAPLPLYVQLRGPTVPPETAQRFLAWVQTLGP